MKNLALYGGQPVRDTYLAYGRQWISDEDIGAVTKVLKSDYLTTGPQVGEFEEAVAEYVGAKYGVAVANGTAALHMACDAAGIGPSDEVILSPLTFAASANCILYQGGKPVFVDIDPATYNIDTREIERKITPKTKAIIPVDFAGQPVMIEKIKELADAYGLTIIEDAAHGLGSEYRGEKIGSMAHMTEFSFHPVKPITTGEGGIVTTNDEGLYNKMKDFRTHGITRDPAKLARHEGPWYYEQQTLGYNYRITDLQCALGMSQLRQLDSFIERRRALAAKYDELLGDYEEIITPYQHPLGKSGWHLYVIQLKTEALTVGRREIFEALRAENIGVNVHYIPVYYHPYYQKLGYKLGLCPVAEEVYSRSITLPLFPKMQDGDVEDVVRALNKVLHCYRK